MEADIEQFEAGGTRAFGGVARFFFGVTAGVERESTISPVTPVPLTSTWYEPLIEYRACTASSAVVPT